MSSYSKIVKYCYAEKEHLSQLPDVRIFAMTTTMPTEWNAEIQLEHELESLRVEMYDFNALEVKFFNDIKPNKHGTPKEIQLLIEKYSEEELSLFYFKYPVILWIYMKNARLTRLFASNSFIIYLAGGISEENPWKPQKDYVGLESTFFSLENKRAFQKYTLLGDVPYLKEEPVEKLHKDVLDYYFVGRSPTLPKAEFVSLIEREYSYGVNPLRNTLPHVMFRGIPHSELKSACEGVPSRYLNSDILTFQYGDITNLDNLPNPFEFHWDVSALICCLSSTSELLIPYFKHATDEMIYNSSTEQILKIHNSLTEIASPKQIKEITEKIIKRLSRRSRRELNLPYFRFYLIFDPSCIAKNVEKITKYVKDNIWKIDLLFVEKTIEYSRNSQNNYTHFINLNLLSYLPLGRVLEISEEKDCNDIVKSSISGFESSYLSTNLPRTLKLIIAVFLKATKLRSEYFLSDNHIHEYLEWISHRVGEIPPTLISKVAECETISCINPVLKALIDLKGNSPRKALKIAVSADSYYGVNYCVEELNSDLRTLDPIWLMDQNHNMRRYIISCIKRSE